VQEETNIFKERLVRFYLNFTPVASLTNDHIFSVTQELLCVDKET